MSLGAVHHVDWEAERPGASGGQQEVWFLVRFKHPCRDKGLSIGYRSAGMLKNEAV